MADFNRALEINKNHHRAYFERSSLKFEQGDWKGPLADLDRALLIKKDFAGAYGNRGMVKQRMGDIQGAIPDLNRAIQIDPPMRERTTNGESSS